MTCRGKPGAKETGRSIRCRLSRGPGRPVQLDREAREAIILDAAERVLTDRGPQQLSMAAIAREAGMSKRTLYDIFDSRQALVTGCIRRARRSLFSPLSEEQKLLPLRERLKALLSPSSGYVRTRLPDELLRIAIFEARTQPEMAQRFLREGPNAMTNLIRGEIDRAVERGEITVKDTQAAAVLLRDMVFDNLIELLLDPARKDNHAKTVSARLDFALDVFLNGVGTKTAAPAAKCPP